MNHRLLNVSFLAEVNDGVPGHLFSPASAPNIEDANAVGNLIGPFERAYQIPDGIRILDVWRGSRGKEVAGDAVIHFSKKGYIEQSVIHLAADDGRQFTLILSPFLGRVKVVEEYVEFAET